MYPRRQARTTELGEEHIVIHDSRSSERIRETNNSLTRDGHFAFPIVRRGLKLRQRATT